MAPGRDCGLCPRLADFRQANRRAFPDWHNAPVPSFGSLDARLLVVGLAPGLKGANRTGRPFTGDYAGDLLYATLLEFGLAEGTYGAAADDGLALKDCRITNAVRCVPPENKPTGPEETACRSFLASELAAMPNLKVLVALGSLAHNAVLAALGEKKSTRRFAHAAHHTLNGGLALFDSYHCSRYNTNTRRLTPAMFRDVFHAVAAGLNRSSGPNGQ
ncbi:MAG: uracil-DNA glycosylase [Magnetospirillum sp. WYHS-4]